MSEKILTEIPDVPITQQHPVPQDSGKLRNSGVPRATSTASFKYGEGNGSNHHQTVLQQHVAFFDRNGDGVITMADTFIGFRRLGFNLLMSVLGVFVINFGLAYFTQPSWIPDPFLRIHLANLHKCKHGSDSETYDPEGRFVPQKFEEIFTKYDRGQNSGLHWRDIVCMIRGNSNAFDLYGCSAAFFEWGILYLLVAKNGFSILQNCRTAGSCCPEV
jgi:peroxygenase